MIHLVYSNHLEALADALAQRLAAQRSEHGYFETLRLIVPSRHLETYAKLRLADTHGIAFNLRTYQLDRLLHELLEDHGPGLRLLDLAVLRGLLLAALLDGGRGHDDLAPVSDYVHGRDHHEDAADLRKFQLANELAVVFQEYSFHTPGLLQAWRRDHFSLEGGEAQEERWQRALWRQVFGPGGLLAERRRELGVSWVSFGDLLDPESPVALERLPLPPTLHVFGVSHGGPSLARLLAALGRRCEVHVYALNPCAEYWEDVASPARRGRTLPKLATEEPDPPLLRLWGRPGRDGAKLLNELASYQFEERFVTPEGATLLGELQRDILFRMPERQEPTEHLKADRSLCVLACPGVRREIETIASEIWELLRRDPTLRFHDIGLIVGTREAPRYLPQIAAVFSETAAIPLNILDLPLATESRVVEAIELLLSMPFGGFSRQELLRLCTHPLLAARFPDDDPEAWIRWCDSVGIVHGADHTDHQGTYITRDLLNWEQGVRRLALGAFLTGERSGDDRSFSADGEQYLPEEHSQAGQLGAGRFGLLVRSLIADARFARQGRRPLDQWVRFMTLLATSYLTPTTEHEEKELTRCLEALQQIDDGSLGASPIPYRLAHQLGLSALAELKATRGHFSSDGVVVGPLHKLRGLPFRVLFFTGLNEGRFPEIERRSALDIRQDRQPGADSTGPRERDKYAFLEALLAARDAFYMSYVHRDLFTQEALQPSSVVLDLLDVLRRGYLGRSEAEKLVEKHPLRRFDPAYFPDVFQLAQPAMACWQPEARREAQSVELRRQLGGGAPLTMATLRSLEHRAPEAWPLLRHHLRLFDLPEAPERQGELRLRVTSLRRFLECPLQGYAQYALGLDDGEDDGLAPEDEPFATSVPRAVGQLRAWMAEALVRGVEPSAIHERRVNVLEQRGKAPTGIFADVEQQTHRAWLRTWYEAARKLLGDGIKAEVIRFGVGEEHGYEERIEAPIPLDVPLGPQTLRAHLSGATGPLLRSRRGSLLFVHRAHDGDSERQEKLFLRGFFDHLLLAASGRPPAHHAACVVYANGITREVTFLPIEPAEARAYLGRLAADLLTGPHTYLLPCEAVFPLQERPEARIEDLVEAAFKRPGCSSRYGPIQRLEGFRPPHEAEARALVQRRFGPFFARVQPPG
ncbi:MAG: exodeoxyribonuclease V subunit gamma [Polyangiaceae bacterium]|nr:exodeoxyribonuclease V subunit gamma [Polyangiaceae bacterium]